MLTAEESTCLTSLDKTLSIIKTPRLKVSEVSEKL